MVHTLDIYYTLNPTNFHAGITLYGDVEEALDQDFYYS